MKDEKILKKINKLLSSYGVDDEKLREEFLADLVSMKDKDEEVVEEKDTSAETEKVETPKEDETPIEENKEVEETTEVENKEEVETTEEPKEEVEETEKVEEEEPSNESEENSNVEEQKEEVVEDETIVKAEELDEQPKEEYQIDYGAKIDEQNKTIEALVARLTSLEDIISKLGVEQKPVGLAPETSASMQGENDAFNYFTRKRLGN